MMMNACKAFLPYVIGLGHVHLFDTQSAPRMSREPFDIESPNFTWTSVPTYSTATPDMTSLSTSGRKLLRTNCRK